MRPRGRRMGPIALGAALALLGAHGSPAAAQDDFEAAAFERPVSAAPQVKDIGGGYELPPVQRPLPRGGWLHLLDVGLLATVLGLTAWGCQRGRRRWPLAVLSLASLAYFGFYRQGCVCAVGSIQNVAVACVEPHAAVPWVVTAFFLLPLAAALAFGRVFCGAACPLGALQDVVLVRPLQLPSAVDRWGGAVRYAVLLAAIGFAVQPLSRRDFILCRFDPLVGFFRFEGALPIMLAGATLLAVGTVVGRPYCRFLCPYGALLGIFARFAWRPVSITPDQELDCGLCAEACPFGAIVELRADRMRCVACGRCFAACPRQRVAWGEISEIDAEALAASARALAAQEART